MKAKALWLTGLPCAGKTTIANALAKHFPRCQLLDGDAIRETPLGRGVGFTPLARREHILRMGHLAKMFVDQGITTICAFVSPERAVRDAVRDMFTEGEFYEIYVATPRSVCEERDVKGMYAKARAGEIKDFTGVDAPYETPNDPDIKVAGLQGTLNQAIGLILHRVGRQWERQTRYHLFCGRWNGQYHKGHEHIVQQTLDKYPNDNVLLAIRDVEPDDKNPWTAAEVREMLEYRYAKERRVHVTIIPDISSIEYGRGVGYTVNEIKVSAEIADISGTKCREMIEARDEGWQNLVSPRIAEFLQEKYDR